MMMCDYCGCCTHEAIALLSIEHETLIELLADLQPHVEAHNRAGETWSSGA